MPGDREAAPIGERRARSATRWWRARGRPRRQHSALQVVAVTAAGMLVGSLPHLAVGRSPRPDAMARRLFTVAVIALCFRPVLSSAWPAPAGCW